MMDDETRYWIAKQVSDHKYSDKHKFVSHFQDILI